MLANLKKIVLFSQLDPHISAILHVFFGNFYPFSYVKRAQKFKSGIIFLHFGVTKDTQKRFSQKVHVS